MHQLCSPHSAYIVATPINYSFSRSVNGINKLLYGKYRTFWTIYVCGSVLLDCKRASFEFVAHKECMVPIKKPSSHHALCLT